SAGVTVDVSAASQPISVTGGTGNDTFTGGSAYDHFDGGAGTDTAVFHGVKGDYKIGAANGTISVQDTNSSDGNDYTDYLTNVETLRFSDGSLSVSAGQSATNISGLSFTGATGSGVTMAYTPSSTLTVETSIKFSAITGERQFVLFGTSSGAWNSSTFAQTVGNHSTDIWVDPTTHHFVAYLWDAAAGAGVSVEGTTAAQAGQWYNLALSAQNGGALRLYVNGVEEGTAGSVQTMSSGDMFVIAANANAAGGGVTNAGLNGEVAGVAIWDSLRSGSQIQSDSQAIQAGSLSGGNLQGYWNFSSASGGTITPTTGSVAMVNNSTPFTEALTAAIGSSLTGTGTADIIDVGTGFGTVDAGGGNDTIKLSGSDLATMTTIIGGAGTDTAIVANAGTIDDTAAGKFTGVETLTVTGGAATSVTFGALGRYNGVNTIDASAVTGNLTVETSANFNGVTLVAGSGYNSMNAGAGVDAVRVLSSESETTLSGFSGQFSASFTGAYAGATLITNNVDELYFSDGKTLGLSNTANVLTVSGGSGNDVVHVSWGVDVIDAGSGGNDTLIASGGAATFNLHSGLTSADTITGGIYGDRLVL
ncbi:hypothetical protein CU669_20895, partial [Paramagnetospirillum kuznetsovii]